MNVASHKHHQSSTQIEEEMRLIKAAQEDPRKFAPLYDKYYLRIFRYILQRVGDEEIAADVTSQTFAKAIFNLGKYEYRGVPFGAWLYRVAQNELNQVFRQQKAQRHVHAKTEHLEQIIEETEEDLTDERKSLLVQALRELNEEELQLIELRFFEQRAFKEIGEIVNLTENNAKVKTFRVVKKLRKLLNP